MSYVTSKLYWKCLSEYCPAGLLVIPRDLDNEGHVTAERDVDDGDYPGMTNGVVGALSEMDETAVLEGLDWGSVCPRQPGQGGTGGGDLEQAVKACTSKSCVALSMLSAGRQASLETSLLQVCWLLRCRDEETTSHAHVRQCLQDKCCIGISQPAGASQLSSRAGGHGSTYQLLSQHSPSSASLDSDPPLARKRRVNDEVSQCIQSYCSGKHAYNNRLWCIVNKCNRG